MSEDELATEILKHVLDVYKDDINNPEKIYEQFIEEIEQRYAEMDARLEDEEELEEEIEIKDEPKVKENEKAKVSEEPQLQM